MFRSLLLYAFLALAAPQPIAAATLGPEIVQNGGFDTSDHWQLGYGWQITPGLPPQGLAFHNEGAASAIFQPATAMTAGATYRLVYTVTNTATSSDPRHWFRVGGVPNVNTPIASGAGTFTFDFVAPASPANFGVVAVYGCACVIDDVSIRELTP